jgi:hypothetical protein
MIKILKKFDDEVLFSINNYNFSIPIEIYNYLERTESINEDNLIVSVSKTNVVSLKIKNLIYKQWVEPLYETNCKNHNIIGYNSEKNLSVYKQTKINETKELKAMFRVIMKYMKPKDDKYDKTKFQIFCDKNVYPKVFGVEFASKEEIKSKLEEIIKELTTDYSTWTIEENTKSEGYVLKNEFKLKNGNIAHGIAFANIKPAEEVKTS